MNVTPEQIRAARALLRIEQSELARRAHVSVVTIRRLETMDGLERVTPPTLHGIRDALEQAGAEFIPDGVRRRRAAQSDTRTLLEDLQAISLRSAERLQGHETLTEVDLYDARIASSRSAPEMPGVASPECSPCLIVLLPLS